MKFVTFDEIKAQLRLTDEQAEQEKGLLEDYGSSAEDTILNIIDRTYPEIVCKYGDVPRPIVRAALLLVDNWYKERSPETSNNLYIIPYSFDLMLKPYMKLTTL